jgi:hypothetical protein
MRGVATAALFAIGDALPISQAAVKARGARFSDKRRGPVDLMSSCFPNPLTRPTNPGDSSQPPNFAGPCRISPLTKSASFAM